MCAHALSEPHDLDLCRQAGLAGSDVPAARRVAKQFSWIMTVASGVRGAQRHAGSTKPEVVGRPCERFVTRVQIQIVSAVQQ
jgi:hypothetical protein